MRKTRLGKVVGLRLFCSKTSGHKRMSHTVGGLVAGSLMAAEAARPVVLLNCDVGQKTEDVGKMPPVRRRKKYFGMSPMFRENCAILSSFGPSPDDLIGRLLSPEQLA